MEIPGILETQVREGRVVLILGAGASMAAKDANGNSPPSGRALGMLLADRFLAGRYRDAPLNQIAEYAINETDLTTVQEYIRNLFEKFKPSRAHKQMCNFKWAGLATTNYDRLIEMAYDDTADAIQIPRPFIENGDRVDTALRDPRSVMLLKLHGCVSRTTTGACPLILTVDQYVDHRKGRDRIFNHLLDWAYELPLVFIGQSIQDPDLRALLLELTSLGDKRPRYFTVVPEVDDIASRFWEGKRITPLRATFEEFLSTLESRIPRTFRILSVTIPRPILAPAERIRVHGASFSPSCEQFLTIDAEYVKAVSETETLSPPLFYKGINPGWSAIEQRLDVHRHLEDTILSDHFLIDEAQHRPELELILLKGHAGSGKSVLLRRIAWEAAKTYGLFCLFLKPRGILSVSALQEIVGLCKQRIYIFIDDCADHVHEIENLIERLGPEGRSVTLILSERINEWNISCVSLSSFIHQEYEIRYLSIREIDDLLSLLERHKALYKLEGVNHELRRQAFSERAGRQLLVALHEATLGDAFEKIIQDEYEHILPIEAQQMYLSVCVLNRLNVPVRAGLISRIHNIPFSEFKQRFFGPLEHVVLAQMDHSVRDYIYGARHPYIAEIVFQRILTNADDRYDAYVRCLRELNVDYSSDRRAFRMMTRGRTLLDLFPNHEHVSNIYEVAKATADDAYLLHQMAIYEMHRPSGDLTLCGDLLTRAMLSAHYDLGIAIRHSLAELHLRKADLARTPLERDKHLSEASQIAHTLKTNTSGEGYAYHTLVKIGLLRLELLSAEGGNEPDQASVEALVKDIERNLTEGIQLNPGHPYLLEAESRLARILNDATRVRKSLEKAFLANPRSTFIAIRLAAYYREQGNLGKSKEILEKAVGANPGERKLHYAYAVLLMAIGNPSNELMVYHLARAFTPGDRNYDAQLLYARQLFIAGKRDESKDLFARLGTAKVHSDLRNKIFYPLDERFAGQVVRLEVAYAFIVRDGINDWIYAHRNNVDEEVWRSLTTGTRLSFKVGFTFRGPNAIDIELADHSSTNI